MKAAILRTRIQDKSGEDTSSGTVKMDEKNTGYGSYRLSASPNLRIRGELDVTGVSGMAIHSHSVVTPA